MTRKEFLSCRIRDAYEIFEEFGGYTPTFAILLDNGTTESFATQFDGLTSKENFEYFMRKMCSNPKVIACTFTSEGWASKTAEKENRQPSECDDREEIIMLLYSDSDKTQEMHLYNPDKNGKLELILVSNTQQGRFTNPFLNPCLTVSEKEKAIDEFQEQVRASLCRAFEELHYMGYVLFFLTDSIGQCSVRQLTEKEWLNKNWLKQMIRSKCHEPQTIAFILAYQENEMVKVILVSEQTQEQFCYRMDPSTYTMKLENREPYNGEFSGNIKGVEIVHCLPGPGKSLLN